MNISPIAIACLLAVPSFAAQDDHWPSWRGPDATGVARGDAPATWGTDKHIAWSIELPGLGGSTPIIWGDRIYLTTAIPTDPEAVAEAERKAADEAEKRRQEGGGRDRGRGGFEAVPLVEHSFEVVCLDRETGEIIWNEVSAVATPHEGHHKQYGSFASASPVTDGERLYVSFGSQGLYTYDMKGELLWDFDHEVDLVMRRAFGEGHSPVIAGNAIVMVCDQEEDSFVFAVDKKTGKELWRKDRDEPSAWATPLVTVVGDRLQLVTSGTNRIRSYAAATGELLWECGGLGVNAIPSVMRHGDTVLAMSGYKEPKLMAVKLGGEGDLTDTEAVLWQTTKGCSYTASPVLHDGRYYTVSDRGFISCFDAASGEPHYLEQRLPRGSTLKASPIAAGEFLYVPTESGEVHVITLGDELEIAHTNMLEGQVFIASPAVANGELFLRSNTHLFCISERPRTKK
ncbi:MAG: outer membrane protein assembly factor BamB [Planctomycetota bacterium]|jgi:outer membrane protein assembly factor BamB